MYLMYLSVQSSGYCTGLKKYEITTFDLKTTNLYLPDRVEFKHQFVKFEAGHAIYIKKENVLTLSIWWKGGGIQKFSVFVISDCIAEAIRIRSEFLNIRTLSASAIKILTKKLKFDISQHLAGRNSYRQSRWHQNSSRILTGILINFF